MQVFQTDGEPPEQLGLRAAALVAARPQPRLVGCQERHPAFTLAVQDQAASRQHGAQLQPVRLRLQRVAGVVDHLQLVVPGREPAECEHHEHEAEQRAPPELGRLGGTHADRPKALGLLVHDRLDLEDLLHPGHQRKHELHVSPHGGAEHGAQGASV